MLVASYVPAYNDEIHPMVTDTGEIGHRLSIAGEDSEPEILILAGGESRGPGPQQVTLAGNRQPTRPIVVIFFTGTALIVIMRR
jgi:hypothetical protein